MAKLLAELLGESEAKLARTIALLEQGAGQPSIDVRLVAEIRQLTNNKLASLKLDSSDTTSAELIWALKHKILQDEALLVSSLKLDQADFIPELCERFNKLLTHRSWLLKRSSAKKLLASHAPNRTMKFLHYRSMASMLKNCPVDEIWFGAMALEDENWKQNFMHALSKLSISDFEYREIKILTLSSKHWAEFRGQTVQPLELLGSVVVAGSNRLLDPGKALAIELIVKLVNAYNHIRCVAAYLAFHQTNPNFSNLFINWPSIYNSTLLDMAGTKLNWEKIIHLADQPGSDGLLEAYDPQLSVRDTELLRPEVLLVHLNVGLNWWLKTSYLGIVHDNEVASLNLSDVCASTTNPSANNQTIGLRYALNSEMLARYAVCQPYLALHLKQLDNLEPPPQTKGNKRTVKAKRAG